MCIRDSPQAVLDATMLLGAFQANIPKEEVYYFFGGFLAMTPIWFGSLATVMHLLAKKIKISHMVWINRFCGTEMCIRDRCTNCGTMIPLHTCPVVEIPKELSDAGFTVTEHHLEIAGFCKKCNNKNK